MATAYAALVSLLNNLELIQSHPRHSFSFEDEQIQSLSEIICFLIGFMETCGYYGAAEVLERRIARAAHAAEDVIESHVVNQVHAGSTLDGRTRPYFLLDLQKVIEDMDFVKRKTIKVLEQQSGRLKLKQPTDSAATTSSTPQERIVVGIDDLLLQLLHLLTGEPSSLLLVIPITGMGGIGKTTLANTAFQHELIRKYFDVCLWVKISQQYVVENILAKLISGMGESIKSEDVDDLGIQLYQCLYRRRYLIILDDMWSVDAWDKIRRFFPENRNGSRIVVTSRHSDMADHFGSSCLVMNSLDEETSWDLFCKNVFAEHGCPPELEVSGKKIVTKCGGLPLAIVVAVGHLRLSSKLQATWEIFADEGEEEDELFDILSSSYHHLPIYLKPCFLCIGIFSEVKVISVPVLLRLWIAEGFLKQKKGQSLEEVAEGCLNELVVRNLVVVTSKEKTCEIHDVLKEICLIIAKKEKFFRVLDESSQSIEMESRFVVDRRTREGVQDDDIFDAALSTAPLLRSLVWETAELPLNMKLLRVLFMADDAFGVSDDAGFLQARFQQVNLRFLVVRHHGWLHGSFLLHSSISLLWSLQTLIIGGGFVLTVAPDEIWEMLQLTHLEIDQVFLPDPLLDNGLALQNLQILSTVANFKLSDEACRRIPNVKALKVCYSDFLMECDEASSYCSHNLGRLDKLESLDLTLNDGPGWCDFANSLTFPSSLKKLSINRPNLGWGEMTTMIGSLPRLELLILFQVEGGSEWNPTEGGFPCLKSLSVHGCGDLTVWNAESSHFPLLQDLSLTGMKKLVEFPSGIGDIATLRSVDLQKCRVCLAVSAMRMLVEQEQMGNEDLRLNVHFWETYKVKMFNKMIEKDGLTSSNLRLSAVVRSKSDSGSIARRLRHGVKIKTKLRWWYR